MSYLSSAQRASEEARTRLHIANKALKAADDVYRAANTEWHEASIAAERAAEMLARLLTEGPA